MPTGAYILFLTIFNTAGDIQSVATAEFSTYDACVNAAWKMTRPYGSETGNKRVMHDCLPKSCQQVVGDAATCR